MRVAGVKAVVNELEVRLPASSERTDEDIARAALNALSWNESVPADRIKVRVSNGWITLEGIVDWAYQKIAAENAVRYLTGVRGVVNLIEVKPQVNPVDVKKAIEDALKRSAEVDASRIQVEIDSDKVTLRGTCQILGGARRSRARRLAGPGRTDRGKFNHDWSCGGGCLTAPLAGLINLEAWRKHYATRRIRHFKKTRGRKPDLA
jgi:osmotically-inducible protein OsmY